MREEREENERVCVRERRFRERKIKRVNAIERERGKFYDEKSVSPRIKKYFHVS